MTMQAPIVREILRHGVWEVTFNKMDGTERVMRVTTDPNYLEEVTTTSIEATPHPTLVNAYEVDLKAWRSFHSDRIVVMESCSHG